MNLRFCKGKRVFVTGLSDSRAITLEQIRAYMKLALSKVRAIG